jgi:hypothetical protein
MDCRIPYAKVRGKKLTVKVLKKASAVLLHDVQRESCAVCRRNRRTDNTE